MGRVERSLSIYAPPMLLTLSKQHSPFFNTGRAIGKLCVTGLFSKFMKAEISTRLHKCYIVSLLITQNSEIPRQAVVPSWQVRSRYPVRLIKKLKNNTKKYDSFIVDR